MPHAAADSALAATEAVTADEDVVDDEAPAAAATRAKRKNGNPSRNWGRLVKAGKIKSMEEIYLHSLPIKEYQIVDFFLPKLKDEVMKVCRRRIFLCCV